MYNHENEWSVSVMDPIGTGDLRMVHIESEDFHHDVSLRVFGDFESVQQKEAYAKGLASKLNNSKSLPEEPSEELLNELGTSFRPDFMEDFNSKTGSGITHHQRTSISNAMAKFYKIIYESQK